MLSKDKDTYWDRHIYQDRQWFSFCLRFKMSLGLSSSPRHFLRMNFFLLTVPCSFRYLTCALLQQLFQLPTGKWILGQLKCSFDIVTWTINLAGRIILSPVLISLQWILIWLHEPYGTSIAYSRPFSIGMTYKSSVTSKVLASFNLESQFSHNPGYAPFSS